MHLACDGRGLPLAIPLAPGQRHDRPCARPLLERIRVPRISLGTSPLQARSGHRRQGLQFPQVPRLPAQTRFGSCSSSCIRARSARSERQLSTLCAADQDPDGLGRTPGRTVGKRVGGNPSRVRISYPPPVPHRARRCWPPLLAAGANNVRGLALYGSAAHR
ncbi:hypothetical protein [Streptomyces sp. NBC_01198]|uniref:hypothetical protein n=1 Tax=Streptomyces sp. NBC_01198 TaxID=2903769 RepID=UPI003FA3D545